MKNNSADFAKAGIPYIDHSSPTSAQAVKAMSLPPPKRGKKKFTGEVSQRKRKYMEQKMEHGPGWFKMVVPIYLASIANQNAETRYVRADRRDRERNGIMAILANPKKLGFLPALPVKVTVIRYGMQELDDDNLAYAFKSYRDGIAEVFGCDDSSRGPLKFEYLQGRGPYGIVVRFDHIPDAGTMVDGGGE